MIRLSTGFRKRLLTSTGIIPTMQHGIIDVYTGYQPESADMAPTGTHVARITQGGLDFLPGRLSGGLALLYSDGVVRRHGSWVLTGLADGKAGWFRWKTNSKDPNDFNSSRIRIDGSIGRELVLSNPDIETGSTQNIQDVKLFLSNM